MKKGIISMKIIDLLNEDKVTLSLKYFHLRQAVNMKMS